jgi:hypothetical protein
MPVENPRCNRKGCAVALEDTIADMGPEEVTTDQGKVKARPLPDAIAADKYRSAQSTAAQGGTRGIAFARLVPGGTTLQGTES